MVPAAFAAALQALSRRLDSPTNAQVAVGVSGGSDSFGLLLIARAWAQAARRPLCALTVDHGLHPDSARWTAEAGESVRRLGVPWRALAWVGPKPDSGRPAAARRARHALLAEATRAAGASVLLLGHTADDMAESELIREETPTHGRLVEWSPSPAWPEGRGLFLLRPLLSTRRADLRSWLTAQGVAWLDDPANADLRFARSRARLALATDTAARAAETGACPPPMSPRPARTGKPLPEMAAMCSPDGAVDFLSATLLAADRPTEAFARALACVSGCARPPSSVAVHRLMDKLGGGEPFTATLSGARLEAGQGRIRLTRELGRSPPSHLPLARGAVHVFDGRFELRAQAAGWRVAPLAGHAAALSRLERNALRRQPSDVRPSLPVLLGPNGEISLPQPFGDGPATATCLVGPRLAAALGQITCESALERAPHPQQARGAEPQLILS